MSSQSVPSLSVPQAASALASIRQAVADQVVGHRDAIDLLCVALACHGHALLIGPTGTAKTYTARSFAHALALPFGRIQCTADLLPKDVTGYTWYDERPMVQDYVFQPGPILHAFVLADELNRAPAHAQSALLEAMGEDQVTVDGETHPLPRPGLLLATLNPEDEGTYPLIPPQLDRFLVHVPFTYLNPRERQVLLEGWARYVAPPEVGGTPERAASSAAMLEGVYQTVLNGVGMAPRVQGYLVDLADAVCASDRAVTQLSMATKAWALLHGLADTLPDHVQDVAPFVLGHRTGAAGGGAAGFLEGEHQVEQALRRVQVPRSPVGAGDRNGNGGRW